MSPVLEQQRPDPYADESTIVRRKRGLMIGAFQGFTIAALACLMVTLFFLGVDSEAQKTVSLVALLVVAFFLYSMALRKSRPVETARMQLFVNIWLGCTTLCWLTMALMLFLPPSSIMARGPLYATEIGALGVLVIAIGSLTFSSVYGRDWASRKGRSR